MSSPRSDYGDYFKSREGKFDNLTTFVDGDASTISRLQHYKQVGQALIQPGSIIHVRDIDEAEVESRLHNRILLVKAINPSSMICFTFCRHEPQLSRKDGETHWYVTKAGSNPPVTHPARLKPLRVELCYGLSPRDDITVNLRDPWNVENEVLVAKLGDVSIDSWIRVRRRINDIFISDETDESSDESDVAPKVAKPQAKKTQEKKSK